MIFGFVLITLSFNSQVIAKEVKCIEISKFSPKFLACKAKSITSKTILKSKSFINKTKEYQKKAWSKENR